MMYRLIVLTGTLQNQRITVEQDPMTIGRDPECTISVPDEEMAGRHAILEHRPDGLYIRDLGSMNRILVNKREVREVRLKHGDAVEIGRTRFLVQALVQAEVNRDAQVTPRRKHWRAVGVLVVVVLAATVAANLRARRNLRASLREVAASITAAEDPADVSVPVEVRTSVVGSEDLRLVREDLAAIRETVMALSDLVQPVEFEGTGKPVERDVVGDKAAEMFREALGAIRARDAARADQLLAGVQILEPDFIPAYEERARLFERRGMPEQSVRQWSEIVDRNPSPELFEKAVGERLRLSREMKAGGPGCIRILSVDQHKVLAAGDDDEMRILKVVLKQRSDDLLLDAGTVQVEVSFYDENGNGGVIEPTRAVVPQRVLRPEAPWDAAEPKTVTATYRVPAGTRGNAQYYGYVVRVFYNERLQDAQARPRTLLRMQGRAPSKEHS